MSFYDPNIGRPRSGEYWVWDTSWNLVSKWNGKKKSKQIDPGFSVVNRAEKPGNSKGFVPAAVSTGNTQLKAAQGREAVLVGAWKSYMKGSGPAASWGWVISLQTHFLSNSFCWLWKLKMSLFESTREERNALFSAVARIFFYH